MLNKLIEFALTQRVFVLVMTAVLCAFGYRAVNNLSIEAFPDVQDVQVLVVTQYPGQAPKVNVTTDRPEMLTERS